MVKLTIVQAKRRQHIAMLLNVAFFYFVLWLVYDLAWYWSMAPIAYVALNLACGVYSYVRTLRALDTLYVSDMLAWLDALKEACDKAAAAVEIPDLVYDDASDRCLTCTRLRGRPHLESCIHNPGIGLI